jgi:hypothetical protein
VANKTNNYKFPKPEVDDFYDISEYNKAMDILDDSLTEMDQKKLDKNGDASEAVTEFEQEILRENIESGETLSSTFGKVKKWFAEMKDVAFSGHAKDVTTDAAHRFVSDMEKSSWNEKVASTGGDISEANINSLESISTEFPVPNQGETTKIFLGKVKKFIQDFNNFKSGIITVGKLVNSGNTTLEGYALDARYGKTLFDLYTKLNSDLASKDFITITFLSSSSITIVKRLGVVFFSLSFNSGDMQNINVYSYEDIPVQIPEEYRPAWNVDFIKPVYDSKELEGGYIYIRSNGTMGIGTRYNPLIPNIGHIYASSCYRTK